MNYISVIRTLGKVLLILAGLLVPPLMVSIIYQEQEVYLAFIIPIIILFALGYGLNALLKRPKKRTIYAKEGLAIVGLSWILISAFGSLPFMISGAIPNFFDAFFETTSGFTTTGASILSEVEGMSKGILFWRSFTHWIGGMGVLVFFLAFFPKLDNSRSMHILRMESPGPQVGKLVSKMKFATRILYEIYIALTLLLILILFFGGMPLFDSIVHAFGTAGTGGFSIKNTSIGAYDNLYFEVVLTVFMLIFSVNFNVYYLLILGQLKKGVKSEELWWFLGIVVVAIVTVTINISSLYQNVGESLRVASFQVASIISTSGFATADFNYWPALSKMVIILLMMIGASAGSTGGGIKVSRIAILFKMIKREIHYAIHPSQIKSVTFEGKSVDRLILKQVSGFFISFMFLLFLGTLIVSIETEDLVTAFTSVLTSLANVGPGLNDVGPMNNFGFYSSGTKLLLSFFMLAGRLEIFPILVIFSPRLWKKL